MSKNGKHINDRAKKKKKIKHKNKNRDEFDGINLNKEISDRITDLFMEKENRKEHKKTNKKKNKEKTEEHVELEENVIFVDAIIKENENKKKTNNKKRKKKNIKKSNNSKKEDNKTKEKLNKSKETYNKKVKNDTQINNKKKEKNAKKNKKISALKIFLKMIILTSICVIAFVYISTSPMFNITDIEITGNNKIDKKTYLNLSKLQTNTNIFNFKKSEIISNIKNNAYVENVIIKRKIPNKVDITIEERSVKFIFEGRKNEYICIDKNGYVLEKSSTKTENIQLTGISTELKNIVVGDKLNEDDITKIKETIQIENSMTNNEVEVKYDKIDVSSKYDYILTFEEQAKEVHLGDINDLNTKILFMKYILKEQENVPGKIFLNQSKMYFSPN